METTALRLARLAIQTLNAQKDYFRASRSDPDQKKRLLNRSIDLESLLRSEARAIIDRADDTPLFGTRGDR